MEQNGCFQEGSGVCMSIYRMILEMLGWWTHLGLCRKREGYQDLEVVWTQQV